MSSDQAINFSSLSQDKKDIFKSGLMLKIKEVVGIDSTDQ